LQHACRSRKAAFGGTVSADRRRGCVSPSNTLLGAPAARDSDRVDAGMMSREASEESRRRGNRFRRGREIGRAERRGSAGEGGSVRERNVMGLREGKEGSNAVPRASAAELAWA
jgi:hypothetical protein